MGLILSVLSIRVYLRKVGDNVIPGGAGICAVTRVQTCAHAVLLRFCTRTGGSQSEDGIRETRVVQRIGYGEIGSA